MAQDQAIGVERRQIGRRTGRAARPRGPREGSPPDRRAGGIAGAGLLLMAVAAMGANVVGGMDAPSDGLFRAGVLAWVVVVLLDIVVAWALGIAVRAVNPAIAQLAAWLRLAYAAVFFVAISFLGGHDRATFDRLWDNALLIFGVHLLLVGWLVWASGWLPRWLGVLVGIAALGYIVDAVVAILVAEPAFELAVVTFPGELLLAIWLLMTWARTRSGARAVPGQAVGDDPAIAAMASRIASSPTANSSAKS